MTTPTEAQIALQKTFVAVMKEQLPTSINESVTVEKRDFLELLRLAETGAKISPVHCICIADQYGCATNPDCLLHGQS